MALQSSGAISLANLQSEYGGANPISISEYYRNGPYVPNSITTGTTVTEGPFYNSGSPAYVWIGGYDNTNEILQIIWNGSSLNPSGASGTSWTSGIYTYYRGAQQSDDGKSNRYYSVSRTYGSSTTTYVNQNVPTSGQISLSQFYGGRKT
jgi:hypothetical protein